MQSSDGLLALDGFLQFLFEGLEGYVYLAASDRKATNNNEESWLQEFFAYPSDLPKIKESIINASKTHEVYLAPAVYTEPRAVKENFKASNVAWTEFDDNAPDWNSSNIPSLTVQSSFASHQHVYWRLDSPVTDASELEGINHRIQYSLGADSSAWDCTQVLRPPGTWNYKRNEPVILIDESGYVYDPQVFVDMYPDPPVEIADDWAVMEIPDADKIILKYAFTPDMVKLLTAPASEVKDRSSSLMNMAYACAQVHMSNSEIMSILIICDDRWEKFKGRRDRLKRLSHIVTLAKNKHPDANPEYAEETFAISFGWNSLIDTEFELDWAMEPMLMDNGNLLLVGPSGVGKTQLLMQILIHLALGKDMLHYKVASPKKILWLSLEMGLGEVKQFATAMQGGLTEAEMAVLEENFIIIPHGEPWALNTPEGQDQLIKFIELHEPDGIAVDSVGSAIRGNISSDESVQPYTEFVDKVRNRYGCFWAAIHHMRKSKDGPPGQDDVYGNQYLLNRSTSTYALLRSKGNTLRLRNFKNRLAPLEGDHFIERTETLNFISTSEGFDNSIEANIQALANGDEVSESAGGFNV